MNKKGYTLIELLVTITIIGIISLMSMPSVRRVQATNRAKKYESYSEAIEKAAKAYVDSYSQDIFKDNEINPDEQVCNKIKLTELINKKLIKNSNINDSTCTNEDTDSYVEVSKYQNKYYYKTLIKCKNKNDNVVYQTPHYQKYDPKVCVNFIGDDETPPTVHLVRAFPKSKTFFSHNNLNDDEKTIKVKVYLKDTESGLKIGEHSVQITWDFVGVDNEGKDASMTRTSEHIINVPNPGDDEPEIRTEWTSGEIIIPNDFKNKELNGTLTISVKPTNVRDKDENPAIKGGQSIVLSLDNKPPKININAYKWSKQNNVDVQPSGGNVTNLQEYTINNWYSGKVITKVTVNEELPENVSEEEMETSGIDLDSITYTTTGATTNDTNKKGTYRSIEAEGKSTITYHVCDIADNCITSPEFVVKLDRTAPKCIIPSDKNDENYIDYSQWYRTLTTNLKCEEQGDPDNSSGCKDGKEIQHKTFDFDKNIPENQRWRNSSESVGEVYDKAGNKGVCGERTIKLDQIKPTCNLEAKKKGTLTTVDYLGIWENSGEITVTANCTDEHSGCVQKTTKNIYSTDMVKAVNITVYDKVGNSTQCNRTKNNQPVTIRIDKTPPICIWDPLSTRELEELAWIVINADCDDGGGSGCTLSHISLPFNYWRFLNNPIMGLFTGGYMNMSPTTTAGKFTDNAGNVTTCPRVRPYENDACTYSDGQLRTNYKNDSLRGNRYYVLEALQYRPQYWTDAMVLLNVYDAGVGELLSVDHWAGYRRFRKVGNKYELCLDESLDIKYEQLVGTTKDSNGNKLIQAQPDKVWPGVVTKRSQGDKELN